MTRQISVFLPVKGTSRRVENKNFRPFVRGMSLLQLKLLQLQKLENVTQIVVSTDAPELVSEQSALLGVARLQILNRESELCSDSTRISDLCTHAGTVCDSDLILWTHVTSPFFDENSYSSIILEFSSYRPKFDSVVSISEIQNFMLRDGVPQNFSLDPDRWSRTQDLEPVQFVNSAAFLVERDRLLAGSRVGVRPLFSKTGKREGLDIDDFEDFEMAQELIKCRGVTSRGVSN